MFKIVLAISILAFVSAGGNTKPVRIDFLIVGITNQCEGKDAGNYTHLEQFQTDEDCHSNHVNQDTVSLTLVGPHGEKTVNNLKILAFSGYPAGAYVQFELLYLALSGNLEGKYVYKKVIRTVDPYLKKCSSVLGYSYVSSKSMTIAISDKLDLNVLISPTGAYETFIKGCTTICTAQEYVV